MKSIRDIQAKAEDSEYIPDGNIILRSAISAIPWVGGSLDHLLFDKASEIRIKNIEKSVNAISNKISQFEEEKIDKEWFENTEAIEVFRILVEKIQFESDDKKINTLSKLYAVCGTKKFIKDQNKFIVLQKISEITNLQKDILKIISELYPINKRIKENKLLIYSGTGIWLDDITDAVCTDDKLNQSTKENINLKMELDILESTRLIRRIHSPFEEIDTTGYQMTALGILLIKYLEEAN